MQLFHHYYTHSLDKLIHSDLWLFELSIWLHVFGRSMIAIFVPILLLNIGYSLSEVITYYLIFNIFDVPLNFVVKFLIQKIGARRVLILGNLALIIFFGILYSLSVGNWLLLIIMAFFAGFYDSFFWVSHLYLFMKSSKNNDNALSDTSNLYIVKRVAGILAPMFGALILILFSKNILIIVSVGILILSIVPLFKMKGIEDKPVEGKTMSMRRYFNKFDYLKEYIIRGVYTVHIAAEDVIWPIFIYTIFVDIKSVAIIPVMVSLTVILFSYFAGKIKKTNRGKMVVLGSFLVAITWILRIYLQSEVFYFASVALIGLFSILISLPIDSNIFEKGELRDPLAASTYRNTLSMFPRIFFYGALLLMLDIFKITFIAASVSTLVVMAVSYILLVKKPRMSIKEI